MKTSSSPIRRANNAAALLKLTRENLPAGTITYNYQTGIFTDTRTPDGQSALSFHLNQTLNFLTI